MTNDTPRYISLDRYTTPIGVFLVATDDKGRVRAIDLDGDESRTLRHLQRHFGESADIRHSAMSRALKRALDAYFVGDLHTLDDIPCVADGTAFQQSVWSALRAIPAGQTLSYSGLAERLGKPRAVRAVGLANGSNPIPLIIPCHRVIGADGSLTGYGGGLERKRWLLTHEGRFSPLLS
jgi:methylated-DNA-[protein]-cysteine S-methyltransferase